MRVSKIAIVENPVDCFTKALPSSKFRLCLGLFGLH